MSAFVFDKIEKKLGLIVPTVFRNFIAEGEALEFPFLHQGFCWNTDDLIKNNREIRSDYEGYWQEHFLFFGEHDDSGDPLFIAAQAAKDDQLFVMSHDPPGEISDWGLASEHFNEILSFFEREKPWSKELQQRDVVNTAQSAIDGNITSNQSIDVVDKEGVNLIQRFRELDKQVLEITKDSRTEFCTVNPSLAVFIVRFRDVVCCLVYSKDHQYLVSEVYPEEMDDLYYWFDFDYVRIDLAEQKLLELVSTAFLDEIEADE